MSDPNLPSRDSIGDVRNVRTKPLADHGMKRGRRPVWSRVQRSLGNKKVARTEQSMLPMLIEVFAGFTKLDGQVVEAEIDSILGFLRYDFPETVYTELREHFMKALRQRQDLDAISKNLAGQLPLEDKILLGVQLYVLISRAGLPKENLITFYQFMTTLGVASEAISIVYQLNTSELSEMKKSESDPDKAIAEEDSPHQLESLIFSNREPADVIIGDPEDNHSVAAFRFLNLLLVKNLGPGPILARGRQVNEGEFCRVYEGQRILIGEEVLAFEDLIFYFNSKKNVSSVQLYLAQEGNGAHYIEKTKTKQSYLRVSFGLKIIVEVLNETQALIADEPLTKGSVFEVSSTDRIEFADHTEIEFSDLRKKARDGVSDFE